MSITLQNHIVPNCLLGGADDAPSLTLWIDVDAGVAHLTGHSGSMTPLAGPVAPAGAPMFEAIGKKAHVLDLDPFELQQELNLLETLLDIWMPDQANTSQGEGIQEILESLVLSDTTYEEWLSDNDPETLAEVYG